MAYNGYLVRFSGGDLPLKYITDYSVSPNKRTDLDSYQDADGVLHRNVLPHLASKIEFNTRPLLLKEWEELITLFKRSQSVPMERKFNISYYNPEDIIYATGEFYMPDFDFKIVRINNDVYVDGVRFALIEY